MRLQPADPAARSTSRAAAGSARSSGCAPTCRAGSSTTRRTGSSTWPPAAARCSTSASTRRRSRGCSSAGRTSVQTTGRSSPTGSDLTVAMQWGYADGRVAQIYCSAAGGSPFAGARSPAPTAGSASNRASTGRAASWSCTTATATEIIEAPPIPATATGTRSPRSSAACGPASWRARSCRSTTRWPSSRCWTRRAASSACATPPTTPTVGVSRGVLHRSRHRGARRRRRGEEQVSLEWLADRLQAFVDANPDFETAVDRFATWLAARRRGRRRLKLAS